MTAATLRRPALLVLVAASAFVSFAWAQNDTLGHQDTPVLSGTRWHVHDGLRPQPPVVTPARQDDKSVPAPSDAIVLFDGKSLDNWRMNGDKPGAWKLEKGAMVANRTGDIRTKQEFGDCQIHIEWATPKKVEGGSQGRGNSGVFIHGRYEIQVLDSYNNPTYPDGQAGAVYGQQPPLANASRKPGEWQTYDIFFTAPRFVGENVSDPAYVTVVHNGVLIQNHTPIAGATAHMALPRYSDSKTTGPIRLQDHGNPTRFRNIWVRPLAPQSTP
jgi:hypothetical protein